MQPAHDTKQTFVLCHEDVRGSGSIDANILTSALDGDERSASRSCRFTHPQENRASSAIAIGNNARK
jgi:hypothetical protein